MCDCLERERKRGVAMPMSMSPVLTLPKCASQSFDTETECTVLRGTGWCLQDIVPAEGKVGGGGVIGNRLHHEGRFAIGTVVERWWPHHGGWKEAKVTAYSKGTHMYAPYRSFAAAAEVQYCRQSVLLIWKAFVMPTKLSLPCKCE